ncbi:uncharacterized protein BXZ73DRAFT_52292 [Epithele typhae]|uniref:uncharacterized protein n=1 Tax=Epithele typhae TaxID=378194 RepID=UPI002008286A|nr:uncharacterized protein BXZ73DRAFT_52292 [Epithele typhae]KAH9920254.1 hypothetical protein BXZ73DRAFT_52292 [Epithele typhae]
MADVPDDVLSFHLERLRKESTALARGKLSGRRSAAPSQVGHTDDDVTMDTLDRRSSFVFGGPREMGVAATSPSSSRACFSVGHYEQSFADCDGEDSDEGTLSEEECGEEDWKAARHVLFSCREIVQTERNYQERLRELACTELAPRFASLVAKHVPALLRVSERFLSHIQDDPSAWGVSAAFIGCEEELEPAFVAWSAIVGEFFAEGANLRPSRKLAKRSSTSDDLFALPTMRTRSFTSLAGAIGGGRRASYAMSDIGHGSGGGTSSPAFSRRNSGVGLFTAALGAGLGFGLSSASSPPSPLHSPTADAPLSRVSSSTALSRAVSSAWKRVSVPSTPNLNVTPSSPFAASFSVAPSSPPPASSASALGHGSSYTPASGVPRGASSAHGHGGPAAGMGPRKTSDQEMKSVVRDLAIQPIQRVMRYVLKYRGLLDHMPATSPSRALVERAHESALRIARNADRAQAHAAFARQLTPSTKSEKGSPRPQKT